MLDLVLWTGIEPEAFALEVQSLTSLTASPCTFKRMHLLIDIFASAYSVLEDCAGTQSRRAIDQQSSREARMGKH